MSIFCDNLMWFHSDSSPEPTEAAATERAVGLISTGRNPSLETSFLRTNFLQLSCLDLAALIKHLIDSWRYTCKCKAGFYFKHTDFCSLFFPCWAQSGSLWFYSNPVRPHQCFHLRSCGLKKYFFSSKPRTDALVSAFWLLIIKRRSHHKP